MCLSNWLHNSVAHLKEKNVDKHKDLEFISYPPPLQTHQYKQWRVPMWKRARTRWPPPCLPPPKQISCVIRKLRMCQSWKC